MQWRMVTLSDDQRRLQIIYVGGDGWCTRSGGILVVENDSSVTIAATGTSRKGATQCPAMLQQYAGTVALGAPLGKRSLLHAPVSPQWADIQPR